MNIVDDIRSVSELKRCTHEIFSQIHRTGRPVIVTVNGKPDVVMLDAAVFQKKLMSLNLATLLAEAEADAEAGKIRPARTFLREFKRAKKIPRSSHHSWRLSSRPRHSRKVAGHEREENLRMPQLLLPVREALGKVP